MRARRCLLVSILLCGSAVINSAAAEEAADTSSAGKIRYIELKPTFVTNFGVSETGHMRYVKADITVRVTTTDGEYATRYHLPALRNSLVMLLSRQDESTVSSNAGRQTIKAEALQELRGILAREEGEEYIEDLMFTNFVVQR